MNMHHPPTSAELLDEALAHQAPGLVKVLDKVLDGDQLAQLAHAIDRRVYIAKKDRDEELTDALDEGGAELLDEALLHQASRVVQLLSEAMPANRTGLLRELAKAIGDRVDAATRQHDEEIARHLDEAADRIRARYDFALQIDEACAGDEDPARLVHLLGDDLVPACGGADDPGTGWVEATVLGQVTCPACREVSVAPAQAQLDHSAAEYAAADVDEQLGAELARAIDVHVEQLGAQLKASSAVVDYYDEDDDTDEQLYAATAEKSGWSGTAAEVDALPVEPPPCDHAESLYGRCVACGMTWEQQAEAAGAGRG